MYTQNCTWAKSSIIVTIFLVMLLVGACVGIYYVSPLASQILTIVLIAGCAAALFFFPMKTQVGDQNLDIIFSARVKSIPLAQIKSAKPYKMPMKTIRVCGSGAFFGWYGWFRNSELGTFMVYAANLDSTILVELTSGKKYLISCSDPAELCSHLSR